MRIKFIMMKKKFYLLIPLLVILPACSTIISNFLYPRSSITYIYQSPKYSQYNLSKIAIAPMMNDDTTEVGTLYSTNHFINALEKKYKKLKFFIPDTKNTGDPDSLVFWIAQSIEEKKHLDLNDFYATDLGDAIRKGNADAVFIGVVDLVDYKNGAAYNSRAREFSKTTITSCYFTYYLISLKDGRVLFKISALGEEGFYVYSGDDVYPELDYAISNGMDQIIEKLPF